VKPIDLIKDDLGEDVWEKCLLRTSSSSEIEPFIEFSPFAESKTYFIHGWTRQFEFKTLPGGSYCIYDANSHRAIRLTRKGKEIESVLSENWLQLSCCDPVVLSRLILKFYDAGIMATHDVLRNSESLRLFGKNYVLNEKEFAKTESFIETTKFTTEGDYLIIRAVTLSGWMHSKRNLGIEHIRISRSGDVKLDSRKVLSKKIFKSIPAIRY